MRLIRKNSKLVLDTLRKGGTLKTYGYGSAELLCKDGGRVAWVSWELCCKMLHDGQICSSQRLKDGKFVGVDLYLPGTRFSYLEYRKRFIKEDACR